MLLESIHLTNYRGHRDLTVQFDPHFNVLVGVNGSGKTSLLSAICDAMAAYTLHLPIPVGPYSPLQGMSVVRMEVQETAGRLRFEPQFPVRIRATGVAFSTRCQWSIAKSSAEGNPQFEGPSPGDAWQVRQRNSLASMGTDSGTVLPVVAFYRATRQWSQSAPSAIAAATKRESKLHGYSYWADAALDFAEFQGWAITKCFERLESSSEEQLRFDQIHDDELALVNEAIGSAVDGAKGLRYDFKQKSLLIEWQNLANGRIREPTQFENLSDGQRSIIGLVGDIARRMCLLNPLLGRKVVTDSPGVVLIDELDLHLHPQWQRLLTIGLKKAFPALQFIVASHSPQVLGELKPEEIIVLNKNGASHPEISFGLDSSLVLEGIMESGRRNSDVSRRLSDLFTRLESNDLEGARKILAILAIEAPGVPELDGANALLRRKEVLGK
jgi:predicted ATP-binding protein involved in virulence